MKIKMFVLMTSEGKQTYLLFLTKKESESKSENNNTSMQARASVSSNQIKYALFNSYVETWSS